MYSTTSKQQEGCMFKDSHPKCFIITTNFEKFPREAVAKGGESRWCFDSTFPCCTKSKVNSNGGCNYYDFIRRDGLSLAMWQLFDIVQSAFGENINMTVKIFCVCSSVDVCGNKARMHTYKYRLFLTALFQNLLQLTTRQGKKIYILLLQRVYICPIIWNNCLLSCVYVFLNLRIL